MIEDWLAADNGIAIEGKVLNFVLIVVIVIDNCYHNNQWSPTILLALYLQSTSEKSKPNRQ